MRPNLPRGQAPAKGILHFEQRQPLIVKTNTQGNIERIADPRGYWLGQHTNPARSKKRQAIKVAGGIRQFKKIVRRLRG